MTNPITKEQAAVALRFIALPIAVLTPFWLVGSNAAICMPGGVGVEVVDRFPYLEFLIPVFTVGFLIASFIQIGRKKYRQRYKRALTHFKAAIISSLLTVMLYTMLYSVSQRAHSPVWSCGADGKLIGGVPDEALVGIGIGPVTVGVLVVVYLLAPLTMLLVTRPKSSKLWEVE
jgi:hypothetical protein